MMRNTYYLIERGRVLHRSFSLSKLINFTTETDDAKIYYNGALVWLQNP